jgi:L-amino acid N-acyltransferase YncA
MFKKRFTLPFNILALKGLSILQKNNKSACIAKPASHIACNFFQKLGFRNIGKEIRGQNEKFLMIFEIEREEDGR